MYKVSRTMFGANFGGGRDKCDAKKTQSVLAYAKVFGFAANFVCEYPHDSHRSTSDPDSRDFPVKCTEGSVSTYYFHVCAHVATR